MNVSDMSAVPLTSEMALMGEKIVQAYDRRQVNKKTVESHQEVFELW
jgi:hypothetical protein